MPILGMTSPQGQEMPCHSSSLAYQANRFPEIPALSSGSVFL